MDAAERVRDRGACDYVGGLAIILWLVTALCARAAEADRPTLDPRLMDKTFIGMGHGRRIHASCLGSGSPTVLFEPGGEGSMLSWQKVQPAITTMTRTCFYDRAGMGYSEPPDRPVTAFNVTDEMRAVLAKLGVKGPVVIVGHSSGLPHPHRHASVLVRSRVRPVAPLLRRRRRPKLRHA